MTLVSLRQLLEFTPAYGFDVSAFNVSKMEQVQAIKQGSAIMRAQTIIALKPFH